MLAYWVVDGMRKVFEDDAPLGAVEWATWGKQKT